MTYSWPPATAVLRSTTTYPLLVSMSNIDSSHMVPTITGPDCSADLSASREKACRYEVASPSFTNALATPRPELPVSSGG
jgi:hypothetical protein